MPAASDRSIIPFEQFCTWGYMVPNEEKHYILLLGYSISYEEYNLTGFNHQKKATHLSSKAELYKGSFRRVLQGKFWGYGEFRQRPILVG